MPNFFCFGRSRTRSGSRESRNVTNRRNQTQSNPPGTQQATLDALMQRQNLQAPSDLPGETFTFEELADATGNFRDFFILGGGGFGKVYSGFIQRIQRMVAIKKLDLQLGRQGFREFQAEVSALSRANHPNLVKLIGHCVERDERLIVYEYMPLGSLEKHLFDVNKPTLDWKARVKIAAGTANGLDYLHNTMNPQIIYRDMKPANVLLDNGFVPKLSDFGLARAGPTASSSHVYSTNILGTEGYCAPEYIATGFLTFKSDIYSLGIMLLEIITGRESLDERRPPNQRSLVKWAQSLWDNEVNIGLMVDRRLNGKYPKEWMKRFIQVARWCVHPNPDSRPSTSMVRGFLDDIASQPYDPHYHNDVAESSRVAETRRLSI